MKRTWHNFWANLKRKALRPFLLMESWFQNNFVHKRVTHGKSRSKSTSWTTSSHSKMWIQWTHRAWTWTRGWLTTQASWLSRWRKTSWRRRRQRSRWLSKSWRSMRLSHWSSSRKDRHQSKISMWRNLTACRLSRNQIRKTMEVETFWVSVVPM